MIFKTKVAVCSEISIKHSVNYIVTLSWCCGSVSCVLCESYTVQNESGYGCVLSQAHSEQYITHNSN